MADRPLPDTSTTARSTETRSPVAWLLLVPVVLVLWPPLFNKITPELFGIPFFYWYQLAVIPIGVVCTTIVYRATTRRGGRS
jgi:membrane protein implicated in regulation of membrane protease activity